MSDVYRDFEAAMADIYRRAKVETGYNATLFLRMLSEHGGMETARRLLYSPSVSDGFRALWERKRLDLTVENLVLQPQFSALFTDEDRELARRRLADYGYQMDR